MTPGVLRGILTAVCLLALPAGVWADWGALNMPVGVTALSGEVHALHMRIFYICCIIGALVFGVMFVSMFLHRKSEDFSDSEMSIKVTGYQWRWHYDYMDEGIQFYSQLAPEHNAARQQGADVDLASAFPGTDFNGEEEIYLREVDNELVVPVGKKIRFLHTAGDVIHSWWVTDLAVKKDAFSAANALSYAVATMASCRSSCALYLKRNTMPGWRKSRVKWRHSTSKRIVSGHIPNWLPWVSRYTVPTAPAAIRRIPCHCG